MESGLRIGIDLGGTKIECIGLLPDGTICHRERIASPTGVYARTIEAIRGLVGRTEQATGLSGRVGIGIPGSISPVTGLVQNANSTWLIGHPLQQDLESALERQIRIANDANCFVKSEATDGAAAGANLVFGVILGTGVGAGIALNATLVPGANGIAGEWGHNPLPWPTDDERPGPPCYCGRYGCIETFLSGPAVQRSHAAFSGALLTMPEIVQRAEAGDNQAERTLVLYEDRLARSLAHVINVIDPDVIVLGGGLSGIRRLYHTVPGLWGDFVFAADSPVTRLVPPLHGASSGVRGAAWLWTDGEVAPS